MIFCYIFATLLLIFCSSNRRNALYFAAGNGRLDLCELLIAGKVDVNAKSRGAYCTALHWAAYSGRPAVCELLIAGKADVNAVNRCALMF